MDVCLLNATDFLENETDINVHRITLDVSSYLHRHDFVELAYIASGKGMHEIDGILSCVSCGDVFLINTGVPHRFISDDHHHLLIYNCIFLPVVLQREFSSGENFIQMAYNYLFRSFSFPKQSKTYLKLSDNGNTIASILEEMYLERSEQQDGYRQMLKANLYRLLISLFRLLRNDSHSTRDSTVYPKLVVENAMAYMHNHCERDIRCQELAEHTYVSSSYLARIFKQITGKTVISVLQDIRIEKACRLLCESDASIADIASLCGYADRKFFYSLFSRLVGVTPSAYRIECRQRLK
jgi:AraC-like DNA-binding protein